MTSATRTIRVGEQFGGHALPPPPARHTLFLLALVLAAIVPFASIHWGDLHRAQEGARANTAREMLHSHHWFWPTNNLIPQVAEPPLFAWLVAGSFRLGGETKAAARLTSALAVVATAAVVFGIGERLSDYRRGFAAAVVYSSSAGFSLLGHLVTPAAPAALFQTAAIYCLLRGYQERNKRRHWFGGTWLCLALATLMEGWRSVFFFAATISLLCLIQREARQRFRPLFWRPYFLFFLILIGPWYVATEINYPGAFLRSFQQAPNLDPAATLRQVFWFFPWSLAALPALLFSWRRVTRLQARELTELLPIVWLAGAMLSTLVFRPMDEGTSLVTLAPASLWSATIWDRASFRLRFAGIILVIVCLLTAVLLGSQILGKSIPSLQWADVQQYFLLATGAGLLGAMVSLGLARSKYESWSVLGFALGMIPAGLFAVALSSGAGTYFSLAEAARYLRAQASADVLFEGPPAAAGSLDFYLRRPVVLVNQKPEPGFASNQELPTLFLAQSETLMRFGAQHPVFLVIEQERVAPWRDLLTQRFHVYHQVASCGRYVVLSNQL